MLKFTPFFYVIIAILKYFALVLTRRTDPETGPVNVNGTKMGVAITLKNISWKEVLA